MAVELLLESPISPASTLGPYRAADYWAAPDEPRSELLLGRIYVSPSPSPRHQAIVNLLWRVLDSASRATGGRVLTAPLDVVLADHSVVQPDVLFVGSDKREMLRGRVEGVPDLLVEVLLPATQRRDRGDKLKLYAENGVPEYWIVDPDARQIEFLINRGAKYAVALPLDGLYRSAQIPDLELDLEGFWAEVDRFLS